MRQLLLDLLPEGAQDFDHFVPGPAREAIEALSGHVLSPREPLIYLWGPAGSGKTHLLHATALLAEKHGLPTCHLPAGAALPENLPATLTLVDDVDALSDADQIRLFRYINQAREGKGRLVCAGHDTVRHLGVRPDLASRLGWHLVYQIQPLSDADKPAALAQWAQSRGFRLDDALIGYLMTHWRRDLPSLIQMLERLDRYSLQNRRPVSLPLLRAVLSSPETA